MERVGGNMEGEMREGEGKRREEREGGRKGT